MRLFPRLFLLTQIQLIPTHGKVIRMTHSMVVVNFTAIEKVVERLLLYIILEMIVHVVFNDILLFIIKNNGI